MDNISTNKISKYKWNAKPKKLIELKVGKEYVFVFKYGTYTKSKFIKVSPKGYNFLDLNTNECIMKTHLYKPKWETVDKNYFYIDKTQIIIDLESVNV